VLGLDIELRVTQLNTALCRPGELFDVVVGRFALHHLDLDRYLPLIADVLRAGGKAGFIETVATNPLLQFARRYIVGRFGIPRLGTADEHPLTRRDIRAIEHHFGPVEIVVPMVDFLKLVGRQGFQAHPSVGRACAAIDGWLGQWPALGFLSYHEILLTAKRF
jgi:hypothetical protein